MIVGDTEIRHGGGIGKWEREREWGRAISRLSVRSYIYMGSRSQRYRVASRAMRVYNAQFTSTKYHYGPFITPSFHPVWNNDVPVYGSPRNASAL